MLKKSIKYILIAIINWVLLYILLNISTDKFDVCLNKSYVEDWIAIIIIVTFLSLIGMRFFVFVVRNKTLQKQTKIKLAVIITLAISSFLYFHFITKYKNDIFINGAFRNQIASKIKKSNWFYGTKAENLTLKEYQEIKKTNWFPNLPKEATEIDYYYEYEGILPDYSFILKYNLPKDMKVDTINYDANGFSKSRTFILYKNRKRVIYSEGKT